MHIHKLHSDLETFIISVSNFMCLSVAVYKLSQNFEVNTMLLFSLIRKIVCLNRSIASVETNKDICNG